MLAQAVAGALDLNDDGVMQEPVEERGGDDRIAEDLTPLGEATVERREHVLPKLLVPWRISQGRAGEGLSQGQPAALAHQIGGNGR